MYNIQTETTEALQARAIQIQSDIAKYSNLAPEHLIHMTNYLMTSEFALAAINKELVNRVTV